MNIRALSAFVRISQIGSFARVAEEFRTSVFTISMQMRSLEQELGIHLFDRGFRPPRLTPKGRLLLEQAHRIINADEQIRKACSPEAGLSGVFRIGFVATASVRVLPMFLSAASAHEPNARFEFVTALSQSLEARLLQGELDLAVLTESNQGSTDIEYTSLYDEPLVFAFPPGRQENMPFLQFNPNSGIGKLIESHMEKEKLYRPGSRIVLESVEAIMTCVNHGLGFTLLAEPDVHRYAKSDINIVQPQNRQLSRTLSISVAASRASSDEMKKLKSLFFI